MNIRRLGVVLASAGLLLAGCSSADNPLPGIPQQGHRIVRDPAPSGSAPPSVAPAPTGAVGATCAFTPEATPDPATAKAVKNVGVPAATTRKASRATMRITTNLGPIVVAMDAAGAPCAVHSFNFLAGQHFFDNTKCHRLTTDGIWVLQCGDPSATGYGGPGYSYQQEYPGKGYVRGTVAVANTGQPGSSSSQFFINYKDNPQIPAGYTMLGTVTTGMDIVDKVAAGGVTPANASVPNDGAPKVELDLQQVTVSYDD